MSKKIIKKITKKELFSKYEKSIFALESSIGYLLYNVEKGEVSDLQKEFVLESLEKHRKELNDLLNFTNDINNRLHKIKKETDKLKSFLK